MPLTLMEPPARLALRANPEFQSALVRIGVWFFSVSYIGLGAATHYYQVNLAYFYALFGTYLLIFLGLTLSILIHPVSSSRRYLALLVDISATSLAIFLTREAISPFYLLYIWIFISYGTRYGETHLKLASLCSVLAYNLVLFALDEWQRHTFEAFFFLLLLVLLPLYQYSLLRKVHEARQEAERANQAKSDFLATMTHELRTPLSGVIGMTRLLEATPLAPAQRDYVESIATSAQLLQALIGDILDLSKIEAKMLTLETEPFDPRQVVLEVCRILESQTLDKGLELICRTDARLPQEVIGDPLRLRQILFNLLGNAIKFTARGEVEVRCQMATAISELPHPHLLLEVRDTGIGIAEEHLPRIFDSFWQADVSTTRRYGGTGLGTRIARDLVNLMGGVIGVTSRLGQGSCFWVRLPLLATAVAAPVAAGMPEGGSKRRVLIHEANPTSRTAILEACQWLGVWGRTLESWEAPPLEGPWDAPDLILIADSPAGEDLEAVQARLTQGLASDTPVLLLTYAARRSTAAGRRAHCLSKPFYTEQLGEALGQALTAPDTPVPCQPSAAQSLLPVTPAGPRGLRVLVAEDNAIAARVMVAFLEMLGHLPHLTRDGEETLERLRAQPFDIGFLDLRMPRLDGLSLTRRYRAEEAPDRHLPIVALTADGALDIRQECLEAGMDDFLTKPVTPESLTEVLQRLCGDGP